MNPHDRTVQKFLRLGKDTQMFSFHFYSAGAQFISSMIIGIRNQEVDWFDRNYHLATSELASHHDVYGYIPVTWSLNNDQQFLHLNLGAIKSQIDSVLRKTWGFGAEIEITPRAFLIAETYGVDGVKPSYQAGVRYWLQLNKFQVDLTTGGNASYSSENRWFSIGIRLLLGN